MGINFPSYIKETSNNVRKFKISLNRFLYIHYFYFIEEYFQYKSVAGRWCVIKFLNTTIYLI
jgi:hypothetical protein